MSEKKYAEQRAQAARVIKEQFILLNAVYKEDNNYLDNKKMTDVMNNIQKIDIDSELSKADRTVYIIQEYKKMLEGERRRRKYNQLLENSEELTDTKEQLRQRIKEERKRQGNVEGLSFMI